MYNNESENENAYDVITSKSSLRSELPWCQNIETLHLGGINGIGNLPQDTLRSISRSIKGLHFGCDHDDEHMLQMHTYLKEPSLDFEIGSLTVGLQKLTVSCRGVSYIWLFSLCRMQKELRHLTFLNVNICKEGPIYFGRNAKKKKKMDREYQPKEALDNDGDPYQHRSLWQRFADEFEHQSLSQNRKRHLIVGGPMVNGNPVIVDDSALQTVTVLSAEKSKELRLAVNGAEHRDWIDCG